MRDVLYAFPIIQKHLQTARLLIRTATTCSYVNNTRFVILLCKHCFLMVENIPYNLLINLINASLPSAVHLYTPASSST